MGWLIIFILFISGAVAYVNALENGKKSYAKIWAIVGMLFVAGVIYYNDVSTKEHRLVIEDSFKKGKDILCYAAGKTYIVSKKRDWKRYKEGFSKNDILLDISTCRVEK